MRRGYEARVAFMSISLMCRVSLMKRCRCCSRCHWLCCCLCLCLFLCHCDSQRVYDTHSESLPISGNLLLACLSLSTLLLCYLIRPPANARGRCAANSKAARLIFNLISSLISHLICKPDTVRTRRAAAARQSTSAPSIIYINICLITGCLDATNGSHSRLRRVGVVF